MAVSISSSLLEPVLCVFQQPLHLAGVLGRLFGGDGGALHRGAGPEAKQPGRGVERAADAGLRLIAQPAGGGLDAAQQVVGAFEPARAAVGLPGLPLAACIGQGETKENEKKKDRLVY